MKWFIPSFSSGGGVVVVVVVGILFLAGGFDGWMTVRWRSAGFPCAGTAAVSCDEVGVSE